jgi:subfamily B ATP-binding cassette protein MsbA
VAGLRSRVAASLRPPTDDAPLVGHADAMSLASIARRFAPYLRPLRWPLALVLLLLAAAPAIAVAEVLLFQRLVDDVLVPADAGPLLGLALVYIGLNLLSGVVSGAEDYTSTYVSQSFLVTLREDVFGRVLRQPALTSDRRRLGDTMTRMTSDVGAVETFMVAQLAEGIGSVLRLVFFLGAMFLLSWELTLAALVVVPAFWWLANRFASYTKVVSRERRRRGGSLGSVTEESLSNVALVQAYGREGDAMVGYSRQNRAIMAAEMAGSRVRALFLPMVDLAELIGVLTVVALGVWALDTERLTLGGLLAFLTLMAQCYGPIRDLADLIPGLYSASAGVERVVELLDAEPDAAETRGPLPARLPGSAAIELRDVQVTYPGALAPAFTGLSLRIEHGERVAVIGPSGSGKSTIARLLSRQVEPDRGSVLVDGHDVTEHSLESVRATVTPVFQEQLVMDASIRDNLTFGRPDAGDDDVREAAEVTSVHEFVSRLPDGYETRVGQRGRALSGGQRQRIAIGRALLRPSPVLVLDEPTTGLDAVMGEKLTISVLEATQGRTVIMLTHDPVVLGHVDRVLDLRDLV